MAENLNDLLYDIKRIEQHRVELTDEKIKSMYEQLMKGLDGFLADGYKKYADSDGRLYLKYLDENRQRAAFLQQIVDNVDNISPKLEREMQSLIDATYEECYRGMAASTKAAYTSAEMAEALQDVDVNPQTLQSSLDNNISKLTIPSVMEAHRAQIIYQLQRELTIGLMNGDRYETMAKRISERVGVSQSKAMLITRTEVHRNVESGFMDCAEHLQEGLEGSGLIYAATWRTMKDERVRPQVRRKVKGKWKTTWSKNGADHMKMEGQTVKAGEMFNLGGGVKAKAPSQSGVAAHDCNCRCFIEYNLMTPEEFKKATGKNVGVAAKIKSYGFTDTSDRIEGDSLSKWVDDNGQLTSEREKLHRDIINEYFADAEKPDGQAIFTVMGGGSAAGKSTMLKSGAATLPKGSIVVDSDAIKGKLPEYREMVAKGDTAAAAFVHEESSALAKRIMSIANENGFNVTLDGTGDGSVNSLMKKINNAKQAGLRVEGVYATVPTEVALERSAARAAKTGREVPTEVIKRTHSAVSQVLPECAEYFDDVRLFDTTDGGVLIATGGSGKPLTAVPGKEKEFESFLKKAREN